MGDHEDRPDEPPGEDDPDGWLVDLEISLVERFGWSVHQIDETDTVSLLTFVRRYLHTKTSESGLSGARVFADQVDWL